MTSINAMTRLFRTVLPNRRCVRVSRGGLICASAILIALLTLARIAHTSDNVVPAPERVPATAFGEQTWSFPGGVTGIKDIVYASYVGYRPLQLDLYLPPDRNRPLPLVMYVHGGSLKSGDSRYIIGIADFPAKLAALAARGYAVASVNYRLRGEALFPAQVQDVKAAIAFLRVNADKYRVDPARALLWGASSGGQLAALVAMTCENAKFAPKPADARPLPADVAAARAVRASDCVQGVVSWYGDLDLSREAKDPDVWAYLGCSPCSAAQIAIADPMTYASAMAPPMLLVHGSADRGVPISQSQHMAQRLGELKVPVATLYIPDVDHGLVGSTPEITRAANDQALARTFGYIDQLFKSP